jgi:hypothetical protein
MCPWGTGYVPSDGYRYYYHGYNQKIEFEPCHHVVEDYYDADGKYHSDEFANKVIRGVIDKQMENQKRIDNTRTFPHERNLNQGIQCPWCDDKTTGVLMWIDNKRSEMPERQFKAYRIMGWL